MTDYVIQIVEETILVVGEKGNLAEYTKEEGKIFNNDITLTKTHESWESWTYRNNAIHKIKIKDYHKPNWANQSKDANS